MPVDVEQLGFHGDAEVAPDLVDLAVNVRSQPWPPWLAEPIAASLGDLARYPDVTRARAAVAARHGRTPAEVLLTAGAAQAFTLLAQALARPNGHAPRMHRPVVVHPQFTEPEAALLAAGHQVRRVVLPAATGFTLDASLIAPDADLVMIGNPTNPTSVLHPAGELAKLARPGRVLVIDEAFADTVPGEPESLSRRRDLPGLVVLRSLTKTWGLAGLRIGYLLAEPAVVARLAEVQPLWPVSTPALAAALACAGDLAVRTERDIAHQLRAERDHLVAALTRVPGVTIGGIPASSFVLVHLSGAGAIREDLRAHGYAVRRGETFPGLGADWLRIAVRDTATTDRFIQTLADCVARAARLAPERQGSRA